MNTMRVQASRSAFAKVLEARRIKLADLIPGTGFALMCAFYATRRAEGCPIEEDGDALLFQWGPTASGSGEAFRIDIARQFMLRSVDDDSIRQLSLVFEYLPTKELRVLGSGNGSCQSPAELEDFVSFVTNTRAYQTVEQVEAARVTLNYASS